MRKYKRWVFTLWKSMCNSFHLGKKKQTRKSMKRSIYSSDGFRQHSWQIFKSVFQEICCMNTTHVSRLTFKLSCLNFLDYFNQGQPACPGSATKSEHCRTCNMQSVPSGHGEIRRNFRQWLQQGQDLFQCSVFSSFKKPLLLSHSRRGDPASHQITGVLVYFLPSTKQREEKSKKWCMQCALFPWLPCLLGGTGKHKWSLCKNLNLNDSGKSSPKVIKTNQLL